MTVPSNGKRLWTRVSPDGKSMAGAIGMKPGGGGDPQPYDGHGQYLGTHAAVSTRTGAVRVAVGTLLAARGGTRTDAGGLSGGNTVRGPVTGPEKEKYPPPPPAPKEPHLTYSQKSGELRSTDGGLMDKGRSGYGEYSDKPEFEDLKDRGVIPRGNYRVTEVVEDTTSTDRKRMGQHILRLEPADKETQERLKEMNRDGFWIHNGSKPTHSRGCILLPEETRRRIPAGSILRVTL